MDELLDELENLKVNNGEQNFRDLENSLRAYPRIKTESDLVKFLDKSIERFTVFQNEVKLDRRKKNEKRIHELLKLFFGESNLIQKANLANEIDKTLLSIVNTNSDEDIIQLTEKMKRL